ncbi:hypothetical protein DCE93_03720 [Agromyces badenianii]|uniref:DUF559 domain-containing protein n=2 Tax=Agromyces badenianii TaxID=2080742 RepID=A0A2S0WU52_9MICO|nr:hypothetical protein DCE93_03720 [Agromyces badenianii]
MTMPRRVPLPQHVHGSAFRSSDTEYHGLGPKRLRSADVDHPFTGVSAVRLDLESVVDLCRAYEPLLRRGEAFSHSTAARLHGLPLPPGVPLRPLHVLAPHGVARARTVGTTGHEASRAFETDLLFGVPVVSAVIAWCQLGSMLAVDELVAIGDALVTGRRNGRHREPPRATFEDLEAARRRWGRRRGARSLAEALPRVRQGAESRPETLTRLLLVDSGLPEPAIALPITVEDGSEVLHPDLAYPDWRIVIEYEGGRHRDPVRWKRDITRREKFEAAGWRVVRVTSDDLFREPDAFVARLRRVIRSRSV